MPIYNSASRSSSAYKLADSFKYPQTNIPEGQLRLYSEQYISDVGDAINDVIGTIGSYTTREMSEAIRNIPSIMQFTPTYTETLVGQDNSVEPDSYSGYVDLITGWNSHPILKMEFLDIRYPTNVIYYYVTPSQILNIQSVDGYMRLYLGSAYTNYSITVNSSGTAQLRKRVTGQLFLHRIYGLSFTNCIAVESSILYSESLTNVDTTITTQVDLFDQDFIFITLNPGNYTNCAPCYSLISPYKSTMILKDQIKYYADNPGGPVSINIDVHYMSAAKYLTVSAIKFVR